MTGPLTGVRVVELGVMIAGPATSALLAEWGADVIKVEQLEGDPQRGHVDTSLFAMDNRTKRSIGLDLHQPAAADIAQRLVGSADVFVTNLRPAALTRLGLDHATLCTAYPRLVYAAITGYGESESAAAKPGYDVGAFWARTGIGHSLTMADGVPPVPRPGMGDHTTALAAAGGVVAALYARERSGVGQLVETSLVRTGSFVLSSDLNSALQGNPRPAGLRRMMFNPLLAVYRTSDDRWFWLLGVQASRHWPGVCRAINRPELAVDPRFATMTELIRNREQVLETLDAAFAAQPMAYWAEAFAVHDVWWDPQLSFAEALDDPLIHGAGVIRTVAGDGGPDGRTIATPVDFSRDATAPPRRTPEAGEHTEAVLQELGFDWSEIVALKERGAIR